MSEPQLIVRDLTVRFPTTRGVVQALNGVDIELEKGQMVGIVGESGSGKSVTAKTLMNLLPRTAQVEGDVIFEGKDVRELARKGQDHFWGVEMTMVFQDPMTSLNPVKRCGEQIAETLRYHLGTSKKDALAEAEDLLGQVGVPEPSKRVHQYPHELSGGLRQRVVIAMALACQPKLLIADEPTTAVDVTVQRRLLNLLDRLREERGMSMILITHDLGVARGRCDDVAVMYAGRIVERSATETLFGDSRHPYTDALLRTIPRVDQPSHTRLEPIPGRPPEMINPPEQCSYAPRCRFAQADCLEAVPPLQGVKGMHEYACFHPANTDRGREALAANVAAGETAAGLPIAGYAGGGAV
ncbi:MAG: ABC transporter ATP-binding protein [Acidimicrobiales bacterium]